MDNETISALDETEYTDDSLQVTSNAIAAPSLVESQTKQLELLQHLSLYSELLILLSAERGMGKSFITHSLLTSREAPDQHLMIEADISLGYIEILQQLVTFFHLDQSTNEIETLESLVVSHCLELSNAQQGTMLLVIDHAEQLSDETLEDLNHLALLAPDVLHLMLIAPPELEEKLIALPEPQAPVHVMNVEPFTDDEAETLLLQSFPTKEWSGEEVNYILQQSAGNPGKLLYIAQELISGKKITDPNKFPITHIAAMVMILAVLGVSYLYLNGSDDEVANETVNIQPKESILVQESEITELPEIKKGDNVDKKALSQNSEKDDTAVKVDDEIDFNFTEPSEEVDLENKVKSEIEVVETPTQVAEFEQKQQEEISPVGYTDAEKILLASVNTDFVIQLFGSYSEKNAQNIINKYSSNEINLSKFQAIHNGKPWHVVIAGPYKNREIATEKSKKLPKDLQKQKPWIRAIVPVKEQIKTAK